MNVLWYKRDLRIHDHRPLWKCCQRSFLAIYVYEPKIMASPEYGSNQHEFVNDCLDELETLFVSKGGRLLRFHGNIIDVLNAIHEQVSITNLYSYMECGNNRTYKRDKAVSRWCDDHQVDWQEEPLDEICRPHPERDGWSKRWYQKVQGPQTKTPVTLSTVSLPNSRLQVAKLTWNQIGKEPPAPLRQRGGAHEAKQLLRLFLKSKTNQYPMHMSSPNHAPDVCSRLSPHLALGTVTSKQVIHQIRSVRRLRTDKLHRAGLDAYESRIAWRGHFMQRLEDDMTIENQCIHPEMDNKRIAGIIKDGVARDEKEINRLFACWTSGQTGFPMVDASIRSLVHTGWLNFRMRAMIVSFACYSLWLDWRLLNPWLARQFTDYEPGIHLNQLQMQSGSTGMNELRIYNPMTQAEKNDPTGEFMKAWLPELRVLSNVELQQLGGHRSLELIEKWKLNYPEPIVDIHKSNRFARRVITKLRQSKESQKAARSAFLRLGSRKNRGPRMGRKR